MAQIAAAAAAAIADGEGIKMCILPPCSVLCPVDVYPSLELIALSRLGFPPIRLSLKPGL